MSEPPKPWSIAQIDEYRPHMTDFLRRNALPAINNPTVKRLLVNAPVKCGKREMAEWLAKMDEKPRSTPRRHMFVSAFHRKADETQRSELREHNLDVFSIISPEQVDACLAFVNSLINQGMSIVIHLDECDYGSGSKQLLAGVYSRVRMMPRVFIILYSATPAEYLASIDAGPTREMLDDLRRGMEIAYTPPDTYCGAERFLAENLVENATPFFVIDSPGRGRLTNQGLEIVRNIKANAVSRNGRNIAMLRLSKSEGNSKEDKDFYKFLENLQYFAELVGVVIYVDKDASFNVPSRGRWLVQKVEWSNRMYWNAISRDVPILVVHDQTATRSTELAFHDRLYALHDYRTTVDYSVVVQSDCRVIHYSTKYGGFQPIRIYSHKPTIEFAAGRISYAEWRAVSEQWKIVQTAGMGHSVFEIQDSDGNTHPQHPDPMPQSQARELLAGMGCVNKLSLSHRVSGDITTKSIFDSHFFPTTQETFARDIEPVKRMPAHESFAGHRFQNPFESAVRRAQPPRPDGMEIGWLRTWGMWDYDRDVKPSPKGSGGGSVTPGHPRLTICYRNGVLGVAVRFLAREEEVDTRSTRNSMYPSHRA
jgi:hypothetical protein